MSIIRPTLPGRLQGIEEFMAVAEQGSFVGASQMLGMTGSGVGKAVARLEARLKVRLFQRTTRKVSLTVEGQAFLMRCKAVVADLAERVSAILCNREID
ncbi:LysR family transcriptional regulator [Actimicrobium sp. GrIS 1.19]|uniref:LysR family transcriptional regulator n=1 Tax=Actimicrobium sp. GrIS 1.19 TaxID=3071708 RepID=UPI002E12D2B0